MKKIFPFPFFILLIHYCSFSQSVGIGTSTPNASAQLDITHTAKGLLIPRMTTTAVGLIPNPAKGLLVYDSSKNQLMVNMGTPALKNWQNIVFNSGWNLSGNAGTNPATDFIGTTDAKPLHFKVNNTWAGEIHPTSGNVFLGLGAGQSNTAGLFNTAMGDHSLFTNTTGTSNSGNGAYALYSNTTSSGNTANGSLALYFNTTGSANTASGDRALYDNTTGNNNTANGSQALALNSTGNENTATGYRSLYSNTGSFNTAMGSLSLFANTTGDDNTANGVLALYSNTTGTQNTANGTYALTSNTTGNWNTAVGQNALSANTTGESNTAIGQNALTFNVTGRYNTANGYETLYFNTTGNQNTTNGYQALFYNNSFNNTANGYKALTSNTTGDNNTANGANSLLFNYTGYGNTADGSDALRSNSTGNYNTAMGVGALASSSTGNFSTAIGVSALINNTGGDKNIAIGYNSGTHSSTPNIFNTISIGNDDILNAFQNQVFLGNTSTGFIGGKVTWSVFSDARIKNTIIEDVKGLDFILRLRPVTYHISNKAITSLTGNKETPDFPGKYDGEKIKYSGFLAQEVEQAAKGAGYDFSGYTAPKNQWSLYTLSYEQFVVPLVKAMQEQQVIITNQQKQLEMMEKRLAALETKQ
jgi:trimeric autotransporter adhesin